MYLFGGIYFRVNTHSLMDCYLLLVRSVVPFFTKPTLSFCLCWILSVRYVKFGWSQAYYVFCWHFDYFYFFLGSNVFILFGYGLELLFLKFAIPNCLCLFLVCLNLCSLVIFPSVVILSHDWSPCKCSIAFKKIIFTATNILIFQSFTILSPVLIFLLHRFLYVGRNQLWFCSHVFLRWNLLN